VHLCVLLKVAEAEVVLLAGGDKDLCAALRRGASTFVALQPPPHNLDELRGADDLAGSRPDLNQKVVLLFAAVRSARRSRERALLCGRKNAHEDAFPFQVFGECLVLFAVESVLDCIGPEEDSLRHDGCDCSFAERPGAQRSSGCSNRARFRPHPQHAVRFRVKHLGGLRPTGAPDSAHFGS